MHEIIEINLDQSCGNARNAAIKIKSALVAQKDHSSKVYQLDHETVLVSVEESSDAEEEITRKMNAAGVFCFVELTDTKTDGLILISAIKINPPRYIYIMTDKQALLQIAHQLAGIAEKDLTRCEKNIFKVLEEKKILMVDPTHPDRCITRRDLLLKGTKLTSAKR